MTTKTLPYESAAIYAAKIMPPGWSCLSCGGYFGTYQGAEHAARLCCATDKACKCGRHRHAPTRTRCAQCDQDAETRRWEALPVAEWDGQFPLAMWEDDRYFWDAESLAYYLGECLEKESEEMTDEELAAFRVVVCERDEPPPFDISRHLADFLGERHEIDQKDEDEINTFVNEWMKTKLPKAYIATKSNKHLG